MCRSNAEGGRRCSVHANSTSSGSWHAPEERAARRAEDVYADAVDAAKVDSILAAFDRAAADPNFDPNADPRSRMQRLAAALADAWHKAERAAHRHADALLRAWDAVHPSADLSDPEAALRYADRGRYVRQLSDMVRLDGELAAAEREADLAEMAASDDADQREAAALLAEAQDIWDDWEPGEAAQTATEANAAARRLEVAEDIQSAADAELAEALSAYRRCPEVVALADFDFDAAVASGDEQAITLAEDAVGAAEQDWRNAEHRLTRADERARSAAIDAAQPSADMRRATDAADAATDRRERHEQMADRYDELMSRASGDPVSLPVRVDAASEHVRHTTSAAAQAHESARLALTDETDRRESVLADADTSAYLAARMKRPTARLARADERVDDAKSDLARAKARAQITRDRMNRPVILGGGRRRAEVAKRDLVRARASLATAQDRRVKAAEKLERSTDAAQRKTARRRATPTPQVRARRRAEAAEAAAGISSVVAAEQAATAAADAAASAEHTHAALIRLADPSAARARAVSLRYARDSLTNQLGLPSLPVVAPPLPPELTPTVGSFLAPSLTPVSDLVESPY